MIDAAYGEWLSRGQAHQQAGLPIDAMLCYQQALKINRHAVVAQFHLGESLAAIGMLPAAADAWRAALAMQPRHAPSLKALAGLLARTGAHAEAAAHYRRALAAEPADADARLGLALARLALGESPADGDADALQAALGAEPVERELATRLDGAVEAPALEAIVAALAARPDGRADELLAAAALAAARRGDAQRARALIDALAARQLDDPESLRRVAQAASLLGDDAPWDARYAHRAHAALAPPLPVTWPRRCAGERMRIAYLVDPRRPLRFGDLRVEALAYLAQVAAAHPRDRFEVAVALLDDARPDAQALQGLSGIPVAVIGRAPAAVAARAVGEGDCDVLIDLAGLGAPTGALLAAHPARLVATLAGLHQANVAPLVDASLPSPRSADAAALASHRQAIESALDARLATDPAFRIRSPLSPAETSAGWRKAVAAHQAGQRDAALGLYREFLDEQPGFAAAEYFSGMLLRDSGIASADAAAQPHLANAVQAAPRYADARAALANLLRERGDPAAAVALCRDGLALEGGAAEAALWRALGLALLAQQQAAQARDAFIQALTVAPADAETHFNHGVALQTLRQYDDALRAYQRALAFAPSLLAADFNVGVVLQELGRNDAAIGAFETVLARDPTHSMAYKALGDTLLVERRIDDWLKVFDRFRAACPNAVSLVAWALEACQYRADFAALDRYLDRLRQDDFTARDETDLADSLEQILFLMHYFDLEAEAQLGLYRAYDKVARRVYGTPMARPTAREPGRIRIGYLSGDLRNHVMGKMMWAAIRHHDRARFDIRCYVGGGATDEVSELFRGFADGFLTLSHLSDADAAQAIAADDLDILVDLSTHTKNARPGILALKPARVQITHIASCGAVGLSAIDFKLTDAECDPPDNQSYLIETLLPMRGCVYPYRHVEPSAEHPFHRAKLGIADDTVVIGAFVNPLKLSRRCLSLWREVLERVPAAVLAISPLSREATGVYVRLLQAAGIDVRRVIVLPQGRDDAEGQARYRVLDFCLDPLPYGGVNSTLEALDMGLPVVTLRGKKHGERTSASILVNLGVTETIADSGSEYVDIAGRLADDPDFRLRVREAIARGLAHSVLTDMAAHTRALEAAYVEALARAQPDAPAPAP